MQGTEPGKALSTELNRLSEIAARDSKFKFTSLAHLFTEDFLKDFYREIPEASQIPLPSSQRVLQLLWVCRKRGDVEQNCLCGRENVVQADQ